MHLPNFATRCQVAGRPGPADRPPLPPGHPTSWFLINRGTVLERSAYPYPVFDLDGTEGAL